MGVVGRGTDKPFFSLFVSGCVRAQWGASFGCREDSLCSGLRMLSARSIVIVCIGAVACSLYAAVMVSIASRPATAGAVHQAPRDADVKQSGAVGRKRRDCAVPLGVNASGADLDDPPPPLHTPTRPLYSLRALNTTLYALPAHSEPRGIMVAFHGAFHTAQRW